MNVNQTEKIDDLADALESLRQAVQDSACSSPTQLDLQLLSAKLTELTESASCLAKEQYVLESLRFKTMSARLSRIQEAHGSTFNWIFDSNCDAGFIDWLHKDRGIYWISGKPGSGKSTLMKYLYEDERTKETLRVWADGSKLVVAAFFFWSVGTPLQKSQEGLFRSLLFEILRQCPDLIETACPGRWNADDTSMHREDWDLAELSQAIFRIFSREHAATKFCFFIDGLDEYEGRHLDVVKILDVLASSTQSVKVCVSSRQWNVFEDAYGTDASRLLYLEDLTRGDIETYIRSKLEEHTAMTMFSIAGDGYDDLVEDIVTKAEGVFLWVYLVVRSLCEGLTNGDDVFLLQERVRRLPADLEHFFRLIIESVEVEYREIMARTFQVALQATEPLTLIAYSFLDEADPDYAINARIRAFDHNDIFVRHMRTKRRINGRYKGLLEVTAESSASDFFGYRVEFFHRTVHDFLRLKGIQDLLGSYLGARRAAFNANESLCKVYLSLLKSKSWTMRDLMRPSMFQEILRTIMCHARQAELETDTTPCDVLDELEDTVIWLSSSYGNCPILWDTMASRRDRVCQTFLEFVVRSGLRLYVATSLADNLHLIRESHRPLLNCVLRFSPALSSQDTEMPEMVQFLLQQGADPNQWYEQSTVFGNYLHDICYRERFPRLSKDLSVIRQRQEVLEILLINKANINTDYFPVETPVDSLEGCVAWGHLVLAIQRLDAPRNVTQAYLDLLKMLFQHGADPNLVFDTARQVTIWGSLLRAIYSTGKGAVQEGRMRLQYEMARCFLLHHADPDILLSLPGARFASLSDIFSLVFSLQERRSLQELIRLERHRRGKRQYCVIDSARWSNALRSVVDPLWMLATSVLTKWTYSLYTNVDHNIEHANDDEDPPLLFPVAFKAMDAQQAQVLSCTVVLQNTEYSLRIPEMAVYCSHAPGVAVGEIIISIVVMFDGFELGMATFNVDSDGVVKTDVIIRENRGKGRLKGHSLRSTESTTITRPQANTGAARKVVSGSDTASTSREQPDPEAMHDIYDNSILDSSQPQVETPRLAADHAPGPAPPASLQPTVPSQSDSNLEPASPLAGHIIIQPRVGSKRLVAFNRPVQTGPPEGVPPVSWLVNKLRSRNLSELLDTLEVLLFALQEATQLSLLIDLPHEADVRAFHFLARSIGSVPDDRR